MRASLESRVRVTGTGRYLPGAVVTNETLRQVIAGFDESHSGDFGAWVDQVTHIHERRFAPPGERTSDLALVAAQRALESAGIEPKDLGIILYASFTPGEFLPGDHCALAHRLGADGVPTMGIQAACAGSIYGMGMAFGLLTSGVYRHALVVGAETATRAMNYHDPITAILFGDGAGAVVLSRVDGRRDGGMLPPFLSFQYSPRNIHLGNSNVPFRLTAFPDRMIRPGVPLVEQALVEMEGGSSVLRAAVKAMAACTGRVLGYSEVDLKARSPEVARALRAARLIPHQANGRIIDGLTKELRLPPERVLRTIYRYGNISAASNLVALDYGLRTGNMRRVMDSEGRVVGIEEVAEERIRPGELVLMPSIGGGYLMGCVGFVVDEALTRQKPIEDPVQAWEPESDPLRSAFFNGS